MIVRSPRRWPCTHPGRVPSERAPVRRLRLVRMPMRGREVLLCSRILRRYFRSVLCACVRVCVRVDLAFRRRSLSSAVAAASSHFYRTPPSPTSQPTALTTPMTTGAHGLDSITTARNRNHNRRCDRHRVRHYLGQRHRPRPVRRRFPRCRPAQQRGRRLPNLQHHTRRCDQRSNQRPTRRVMRRRAA